MKKRTGSSTVIKLSHLPLAIRASLLSNLEVLYAFNLYTCRNYILFSLTVMDGLVLLEASVLMNVFYWGFCSGFSSTISTSKVQTERVRLWKCPSLKLCGSVQMPNTSQTWHNALQKCRRHGLGRSFHNKMSNITTHAKQREKIQYSNNQNSMQKRACNTFWINLTSLKSNMGKTINMLMWPT